MAAFLAIVHEVDVEIADIAGENSHYTMRFVDTGDASLAFAFMTAQAKQAQALTSIDMSIAGNAYLADLTGADFTNVTSTTVTIDVGFVPRRAAESKCATRTPRGGPTTAAISWAVLRPEALPSHGTRGHKTIS